MKSFIKYAHFLLVLGISLNAMNPQLNRAKLYARVAGPSTQQTLVTPPVINPTDECPICNAKAQELPTNQMYYTSCCKQFICKNDADQIELSAQEVFRNLHNQEWRRQFAASPDFTGWPEAQEHAKCPFCRHYPLKINTLPRIAAQQRAPVQIFQECSLCFDEKTIQDCTHLSCGHAYCNDCLNHIIDNAIHEKNTAQLKCPHCAQKIAEQVIRKITGNDRAKLDALAIIQTHEWLATQPNVKQCPTPDCPYAFFDEDENQHQFTCPTCNQQYCSNCLTKHSAHLSCEEAKKTNKECDEWVRRNTKPCPRCGTRIEKNGGCIHMTCTHCHHDFCWNCLRNNHGSTCFQPAAPYDNDPVQDQNNEAIEDPGIQAIPDYNPLAEPVREQPRIAVAERDRPAQRVLTQEERRRQGEAIAATLRVIENLKTLIGITVNVTIITAQTLYIITRGLVQLTAPTVKRVSRNVYHITRPLINNTFQLIRNMIRV